jgi:type II secretory pathway pseudopilin PulG
MLISGTRKGLTVIELIIAAVITISLAAAIFSVTSSARSTVTFAQAKDEAKQMAELALKRLQTDIAISHATINRDASGEPKARPTFNEVGTGQWIMKVPKNEAANSMTDEYVTVTYILEDTKLFRDGGIEGKRKLVASQISKLEIFSLSPEQVSIEIETSVVPRGSQEPVKHNQKVLATIREAVVANMDDKWLTSEEVISDY